MIAVDTNILVYADRDDQPLHRLARSRLHALAEGAAAWGLPVFCVGEFLRVVSHPRIFNPPTPLSDAVAFVDALLASPSVRLLAPGARYWSLLRDLATNGGATGNVVFDAQIAAVCLEHGAPSILTEDRDFARFQGIRIVPLEP